MSISVLVDATSLRDPGSSLRGFGRYVRAVLEDVVDADIAMSALAPRPLGGVAVPRVAIRRHFDDGRWTFWEHVLRLGGDVARAAPDVFHSPINEPPRRCAVPWVQTLHDVIPLVSPNPVHDIERRRWRWRARAMRRADRIIAVTRHAADAGVRHLGLDGDRIRVIHHGVNPVFTPPDVRVEPDPPYLLYVGAYGPEKGYEEAFAVVERLAALGFPHRLKIVGNVTDWARQFVAPLLEGTTRVDLVGAIDDAELAELYRHATMLVVTSRAEGFGWPAIEAMASATPIVSFDNTSLPEVIGDAGLLVADGDVDAFADAVRSLLVDDRGRDQLARRALGRAPSFDRARSAAQHRDVYREVAHHGRRP